MAEFVWLQGAVPGLVGSVGAEHRALVLLLEALDLVLHRLHHVDRVDGQLQQLLHGSHLEEPDTKEELRKAKKSTKESTRNPKEPNEEANEEANEESKRTRKRKPRGYNEERCRQGE